MDTAARLSTYQRDRALGHLRSLTFGVALVSTGATGVFGYLAFQTNPGTEVTDPGTDDTTNPAPAGAANQNTSNTGSNNGTTLLPGPAATADPAGVSGGANVTDPNYQYTAPTIRRSSSHRSHAVSGGS